MSYTTYESHNGTHFVFTGQNASTGTPNRLTGRMSFFGTYHAFKTRAEAEAFADEQRDPLVQVGTAGALRKYALGMSVAAYCEHLHTLNW